MIRQPINSPKIIYPFGTNHFKNYKWHSDILFLQSKIYSDLLALLHLWMVSKILRAHFRPPQTKF
jgi:hypothetical protein